MSTNINLSYHNLEYVRAGMVLECDYVQILEIFGQSHGSYRNWNSSAYLIDMRGWRNRSRSACEQVCRRRHTQASPVYAGGIVIVLRALSDPRSGCFTKRLSDGREERNSQERRKLRPFRVCACLDLPTIARPSSRPPKHW